MMEHRVTIKAEYLIMPFLLLLCAFQIMESNALSLCAAVGVIAAAAFLPIAALTAAMYMCIPFFNLLNAKMGGTSLYYLLIVFFVARYFLSRGKRYKLREKMALLTVLFLLRAWDMSDRFIAWYLLLIPAVLTYGESFFTENLPRFVSAYSAGISISCAVGYYMLVKGLSIYTRSYVYQSGSADIRFAGLIGDSVVLGQILALLIALNLVVIAAGSGGVMPSLYIALFGGFGLLTYSRSFLLTSALCVIAYLFLARSKNRRGIVYASIAVVLSVALVFAASRGSVFSNYIARFSGRDPLTGRASIASHYLDILGQSPLRLLAGMRYSDYTTPFWPEGFSRPIRFAHNIYLESICVFGIIPAIGIFTAAGTRVIRHLREYGVGIAILPFFTLMLFGLVLHGHFEFSYYCGAALALGALSAGREGLYRL